MTVADVSIIGTIALCPGLLIAICAAWFITRERRSRLYLILSQMQGTLERIEQALSTQATAQDAAAYPAEFRRVSVNGRDRGA